MNLEGYASDKESLSESDGSESILPSKVDNEADLRPAFVPTSVIQDSFGGAFRKAIAIPRFATKRRSGTKRSRSKKHKSDPEQLDFVGTWGGSSSSNESCHDYAEVSDKEPATEQLQQAGEEKKNESENETEAPSKTELYTDFDFMVPRKKLLRETKAAFPKKLTFTLSGHAKGVTRLRFFPKLGHLLLSCGYDGNIFLWSLENETACKVRGYFGHSLAVKDVIFNASGDRFLSCSYDNTVVLWDTATGAILKQLRLAATPNCAIFNSKSECEIVVGLANRKIEHYDLDSPHGPVQTYNHHLGAILSLTAVSDEVFMSTSDDRTVRLWKWHINIPIKIIADPTQHAIPCAAVHPSENLIALQSMDDSIYVIHGNGKYRFVKKKIFRGHRVAGYGIEIVFTNNGSYIMSGDAKGLVNVWSWKKGNVMGKLKLVDGAITCLAAHPTELSVIAAGGRKGDIYVCN